MSLQDKIVNTHFTYIFNRPVIINETGYYQSCTRFDAKLNSTTSPAELLNLVSGLGLSFAAEKQAQQEALVSSKLQATEGFFLETKIIRDGAFKGVLNLSRNAGAQELEFSLELSQITKNRQSQSAQGDLLLRMTELEAAISEQQSRTISAQEVFTTGGYSRSVSDGIQEVKRLTLKQSLLNFDDLGQELSCLYSELRQVPMNFVERRPMALAWFDPQNAMPAAVTHMYDSRHTDGSVVNPLPMAARQAGTVVARAPEQQAVRSTTAAAPAPIYPTDGHSTATIVPRPRK